MLLCAEARRSEARMLDRAHTPVCDSPGSRPWHVEEPGPADTWSRGLQWPAPVPISNNMLFYHPPIYPFLFSSLINRRDNVAKVVTNAKKVVAMQQVGGAYWLSSTHLSLFGEMRSLTPPLVSWFRCHQTEHDTNIALCCANLCSTKIIGRINM